MGRASSFCSLLHTRSVFDLKQTEQRTLQQHCFRLPKSRPSACCSFPFPHKEGGFTAKPITQSLLRKGQITEGQEGCARLSSCPVHPKTQRDILYAAPASIHVTSCAKRAVQAKPTGYKPKQPSSVVAMATLIPTVDVQVVTEYLNIDARVKPLKAVRDTLALELLYHGGLAAEHLGLEGEEFYEGIRRLYGQLPIQSMSSSSFKDSIVPVPNLVAMTELNDIGLGHLLNKVALRKEKALILVTDSTSPLIYKDHGQIMKGDMSREVEMAAQSNHYRLLKYSMLWGKTLTHIAQEARRLVTEISASNPECEIDIVCWWLGNEVCGDYGCLPPLEAMGTAWRLSTLNSVEHVTARYPQRNRDLGCPRGHAPGLCRAHPQQPGVLHLQLAPGVQRGHVTQALNEADAKGLTTVCVDALAQFLVFQDGYHARDTYENRAHFSRCLSNTLLLLDREVVASRLRPGVDALVHHFRHSDETFRPNDETQRIGAEMTATIKRLQDKEEARIQARIQARSSGQPVASGDLRWERADRNIPTAHWKVEQRRAEIERDMQRDLAEGDLDFEAPFMLPDTDLVPVENNGETNFVAAGETVDEALDIEALREVEPEAEPAASSPQTGEGEDIIIEEMYGAPQPAEEVALSAARETFNFRGGEFVLHEMPQATLQKPRKSLWFHHGDLLFFTGLVRGNFTKDFPELKHDGGLWVSIEKCLDVFNKARKRHWGVRQVIQMVTEDRKGRMEMMGVDIQRKEAVNQAYFPVIIRATQGHNASIDKNPDTDISIASAYYSILDKSEADSAAAREGVPIVCLEDVPKILYHRTSRDSFHAVNPVLPRQSFRSLTPSRRRCSTPYVSTMLPKFLVAQLDLLCQRANGSFPQGRARR